MIMDKDTHGRKLSDESGIGYGEITLKDLVDLTLLLRMNIELEENCYAEEYVKCYVPELDK